MAREKIPQIKKACEYQAHLATKNIQERKTSVDNKWRTTSWCACSVDLRAVVCDLGTALNCIGNFDELFDTRWLFSTCTRGGL